MRKILFVPPMPWYMEAHFEYLIRLLSDQFFIEIADVPYPPYDNFLDRFPETQPFQRNPDDFDLIVPMLATHWVITDKEKYKKKTALVWYQPNEGNYYEDIAGVACATPLAEESMGDKKYHSVRFGVDTDLFRPYPMLREDDLLHVGMVGNLYNPRRMTDKVIEALKDMRGVRLMLFLNQPPKTEHDLDLLGGREAMQYIVTGNKPFVSLPNIYNRLDVLIRCDSDPGYSFPVMEAAACRVPVIATDNGIDHEITQRGGGILIEGDRQYYLNNPDKVIIEIKKAVEYMRDFPVRRTGMGANARNAVILNFSWEHHLKNWRIFLKEAIDNAYRNS